MGPWTYGYGHMDWLRWGWLGWIGMVLFWVLIVLGIVWLWRSLDLPRAWRGDSTGRSSDRAIEIVRERYAKGEIDAEQFEKLTRDLTRETES
jgi:putative membrane protein